MARQPLSEQVRQLRTLGLFWILAPRRPQPEDLAAAQTPRPSPSPQRPFSPARPAPQGRQPQSLHAKREWRDVPQVLRALIHGKQPPLHSLWTYAELWEDIHHIHSPRLELIHKIQTSCVQYLGWEPSRMALWPCHLPQPELWSSGLLHFQPRSILAFGEAAVRLLHREGSLPCHPFALDAATVVPLPDLKTMLEGNTTAKAMAWEQLRRLPQA